MNTHAETRDEHTINFAAMLIIYLSIFVVTTAFVKYVCQ